MRAHKKDEPFTLWISGGKGSDLLITKGIYHCLFNKQNIEIEKLCLQTKHGEKYSTRFSSQINE